jgi:hypothetical protein
MNKEKYRKEYNNIIKEQVELITYINTNTATEEQKQKYYNNERRIYELVNILYN